MNNETQKLKDFVTRNEAYVDSASWLTDQINDVIEQYEVYQETGILPAQFSSEEQMFKKMLELDKRAAIEERVYSKLCTEQNDLLNGQ